MRKKIQIKMDNKIKEVILKDRGAMPKSTSVIVNEKDKLKTKRVKKVKLDDYFDELS